MSDFYGNYSESSWNCGYNCSGVAMDIWDIWLDSVTGYIFIWVLSAN